MPSTGATSGTERYEQYRRKQLKKAAELKRRRKRNIRMVVFIAVLTLLASGISVVATYQYYMKNSNPAWKNTDGPSQLNGTAEETNAPTSPLTTLSPSAELSGEPKEKDDKDETESRALEDTLEALKEQAEDRNCRIFTDKVMEFTCPYPKNFEKSSLSGSKIKQAYKDPEADGEMVIYADTVASSRTPKQLMKEYAAGIGTQASASRDGENWYMLSFERNGRYNYRYGVVVAGVHVYYDFSYQLNSVNKSQYDGYISYINEYLAQYAEEAGKITSSAKKPEKE